MDQAYKLLLIYVRKAWLYRHYALGVAFLICVLGWLYVDSLPNLYKSEAVVLIDNRTSLDNVLGGIAIDDSATENQLLNVARTQLRSEQALKMVAREADIDLYALSPAEEQSALDNLAANVSVNWSADRRNPDAAKTLAIGYTHQDPQKAYQIVRAFQNFYLEYVLGAKLRTKDTTNTFLDSQIQEYDALLKRSEESLRDFKENNIGLMPQEGRTYISQLQAAMDQIRETELRISETQSRAAKLEEQIQRISRSDEAAIDDEMLATNRYGDRIRQLEERLIDLLLKYTEDHPDVVALRRTIAELRAGGPPADFSGDLVNAAARSGNPMLEQLGAELARADAEEASLMRKLTDLQKRKNDLEASVSQVLGVEAQFAQLNRNYEVYRDRYDRLVRRREEARIGEAADSSSSATKFQVLSAPKIPVAPVEPERLRLATAVLFLGLFGGVGFACLLSLVRPTFASAAEFVARGFDQIPVIGELSLVEGPDDRRRAMLVNVRYAAGLSLLLGLYGGVIYTYSNQTLLLTAARDLLG